jgi:hypothetical protein
LVGVGGWGVWVGVGGCGVLVGEGGIDVLVGEGGSGVLVGVGGRGMFVGVDVGWLGSRVSVRVGTMIVRRGVGVMDGVGVGDQLKVAVGDGVAVGDSIPVGVAVREAVGVELGVTGVIVAVDVAGSASSGQWPGPAVPKLNACNLPTKIRQACKLTFVGFNPPGFSTSQR